MAVSEAYPDLKANQNFISLQQELANTENKISYSRQFYNDIVTTYNTKIQVFPSNIVAGLFNFTQETLFEVDNPEARKNVKVDFNNQNLYIKNIVYLIVIHYVFCLLNMYVLKFPIIICNFCNFFWFNLLYLCYFFY